MRQPSALRIIEQLERAWGERDFDRFYAALEAIRHLPHTSDLHVTHIGPVTDGD